MIKLKPIAEAIVLTKSDDKITWGDVKIVLDTIKAEQSRLNIKGASTQVAQSVGKTFAKAGAKWALNLVTAGSAGFILDIAADHGEDVGKFLLNIGKTVTEKELKNPTSSEFKKMTGPFWEAIKLSPKVSELLDDQLEKKFIDTVILPKLKQPGSEKEPIPNMDELLGKWLNDNGALKQDADIHFQATSGNI